MERGRWDGKGMYRGDGICRDGKGMRVGERERDGGI